MVRWSIRHLDRQAAQAKSPRAVNRMVAVRSVLSGTHTKDRAAALAGVSPKTIEAWVAAFRERGPESLNDRPNQRGGKWASKATLRRETKALQAKGMLTPQNLRERLGKESRYDYTISGIHRILHGLGYAPTGRGKVWSREAKQAASKAKGPAKPEAPRRGTKAMGRPLRPASASARNARIKELKSHIKKERSPMAKVRMRAIMAVWSGSTLRDAGAACGTRGTTVGAWVRRFEREGPAGLRDRPKQSKGMAVGADIISAVVDALYKGGRLTPRNLRDGITKRTGHAYDIMHATTMLHTLGYSRSKRLFERSWVRIGEGVVSARHEGDSPTREQIAEIMAAAGKEQNLGCSAELVAIHTLLTGRPLGTAARMAGVSETAAARWTWAFLEHGLDGLLAHPKRGNAPIVRPDRIMREAEALLKDNNLTPGALRDRVKARHGLEMVHAHAILYSLGYERPKARFAALWDKEPGRKPKGRAKKARRKTY